MTTQRPLASVSLDLDNLWSYLKTYGDPSWSTLPTYLPVVVPRLLELYDTFGVTGTVFVVGQDTEVDENAEPLKSIAAAGHELGNHSFHHEPWLHQYSRERLVDELARTEEGLERITGQHPRGFRGPGYSLSATLLQVLSERGYEYDASTLPTWIGPAARAYYFRAASLSAAERQQRALLFGRARDGLRPIHPYRWSGADELVEIPVTTFPLLRIPMHFSYVLYLHGYSPALARRYFRAAVRTCSARSLGPSLLLHPLDLLDGSDAPGVGFFPGMGLPAAEKLKVISWCLGELTGQFEVVGTGEHARALKTMQLKAHTLPSP
jgi:peptidoglycan-N-acetylglucosamine deacetylase